MNAFGPILAVDIFGFHGARKIPETSMTEGERSYLHATTYAIVPSLIRRQAPIRTRRLHPLNDDYIAMGSAIVLSPFL